MEQQPLPIYRFTLRPFFVTLLRNFSIRHRHDCCKEFTEALEEWKTRHALEIREEQSYLESLGYVGDFHNKIFKSARYYLARSEGKSQEQEQEPSPAKESDVLTQPTTRHLSGNKNGPRPRPRPRKTYSSISSELSAKIAEYLDQEENYRIKPSDGFALFCQTYREETIQEIKRLRREEGVEVDDAEIEDPLKNRQQLLKIKKTFKNKHFIKKKISLSCLN